MYTYQWNVFIIEIFALFFSADDHGWVREEIVRFLEHHDYTLCIHTRDFVPTATIPHNIKLAIKHSRRMISVVTRSNTIDTYLIQNSFLLNFLGQ